MKTVSLILLFACCFSGCQHNGNKRSVLHIDPAVMASHGETPIRIEPGAALEPFVGKRVELGGTVSDDKIPQIQGVELRGFESFRGQRVLVSGVLQRGITASKSSASSGNGAPVYWLASQTWSATGKLNFHNKRRISVAEVGSVRLEVEQPTWETQAQIRVHDFAARNHGKKSVSCDIFYIGTDGIKQKLKSVTLNQASPTSEGYLGLSPAEEEFAHGSMIKVVYKSEGLRLPLSTWCAFYYH